MSLDKRIVDLEIRTAYQDRLIAELDEVVGEFSRRVETLEKLVQDLKSSLDAPPIGPPDERPPHY